MRQLLTLILMIFWSLCIGQDITDDYTISYDKLNFDLSQKSIVINPPNNEPDFPISYSVIYDNNIVSLFNKSGFVCLKLEDFSRNTELENKLNTKKFDYHWLIDEKLHVFSENSFWSLDTLYNWQKLDYQLPFFKQPKLYDNDKYLVYCDCKGEWGGTVYFYNRNTKETHFATEATACPNTVVQTLNGYEVLSHLGHMTGFTESILVENPCELNILTDAIQNDLDNRGQITIPIQDLIRIERKPKRKNTTNTIATNEKKTYKTPIKLFHFMDVQFFSTFNLFGKELYIISRDGKSFLATLDKNHISILDPIFNSELYTHNPVTTQYDDNLILINLDFWGIGREKEVSMIVIKNNEIIKLDWNSKH